MTAAAVMRSVRSLNPIASVLPNPGRPVITALLAIFSFRQPGQRG